MRIQRRSCGVLLLREFEGKTQLLIVRHYSGGHWGLPKGGQEAGESDLETARRELKEETGIETVSMIDVDPLTESYQFTRNGQSYDKVVAYFLARSEGAEVELQKTELCDSAWVSFEEAARRIGHPETVSMLARAQAVVDQIKAQDRDS